MSPFQPRQRKPKVRYVLSPRAGRTALARLNEIVQSAPRTLSPQLSSRQQNNLPRQSRPIQRKMRPVQQKNMSIKVTVSNKAPMINKQVISTKSSEETHLFIDGSNLYSAQYTLFGPDEYLDFAKAIVLIEKTIGTTFSHIHFYASYNPRGIKQTEQEKKMSKNEFIFYKSAKKDKRVLFFTGYRSPTSGKEKEVDVKLTADMISMALMDEVKSIHLMTGDADFLQALVTIHQYKPDFPVRLLCMENRILYKGLYIYPADIIQFTTKPLKIAKKAKVHLIKKDHAALCVAKI